MSIANCDTCVYLGNHKPIHGKLYHGDVYFGPVCRRNAPGAKGWPAIQFPDTDGCGQHKPKTPAERGTCGNCRHLGDSPLSGTLECREQLRPVYTERKGIVVFSPVLESDWCSRWEAKP